MTTSSHGGLRARLVLGFGFVSVVTALLTAITTIVIGLAVYAFHPLWMKDIADFVMGDIPPHLSDTTIVLALLSVALVVVAIAVVVALIVARRVLRPVGQLARAAGRVAAGDLDVQLEPDGHDELARLVMTFNTMTTQVRGSVEELRRMDANARRFVSDVSHELRSPLAAMTAVTEVLETRPAMNRDEARATRLVVNGIERLGRLVEDLVEISRFDAGTVLLNRESVRVADAVAACLQVRNWTDRVEVDVPGDLIVNADRRRLDVILANLVGNALRHGSAPFQVHAELSEPPDAAADRELYVTVRDHGAGLPTKVLPDVFQRFFKAEVARSPSDGSGLGLAIALENARLHDGEISAANAAEGGAVFTLTLPLRIRTDAQTDLRDGRALKSDTR